MPATLTGRAWRWIEFEEPAESEKRRKSRDDQQRPACQEPCRLFSATWVSPEQDDQTASARRPRLRSRAKTALTNRMRWRQPIRDLAHAVVDPRRARPASTCCRHPRRPCRRTGGPTMPADQGGDAGFHDPAPELAVRTVMVLCGFTGNSNEAIMAAVHRSGLAGMGTPVWAYRSLGHSVSWKVLAVRELHSTRLGDQLWHRRWRPLVTFGVRPQSGAWALRGSSTGLFEASGLTNGLPTGRRASWTCGRR